MDNQNIRSTLDVNPEHIPFPETSSAEYQGIKAGKATKVLDSHGKLVSTWGRRVERFFDIATINTKKSETKKAMHTFQKDMTHRRVALLMQEAQEDQEGKERSNHVDSILGLPDEIPSECTFVDRAKFKKLVEADTEAYLSNEIKRCKSGASLVELKKEVNRLKKGDKVSVKVIDSLNKKIHHQMAVLVKAMPKYLKSIPYDGDPGKDFRMARKKCDAVRNLCKAAAKIEERLVNIHRQEFRDMMLDGFSRDVREIKKMCLARDNLRENKQLSEDIENLRDVMVKPFFNRVSSHPEKYCHKGETNTKEALRSLEEQREIIPNLVSKLNEEVIRASENIRVEAVYMLEKDKLEWEKSKQEKKLEKAWKIQKPWIRHKIESTEKQISKCEKRADKMRKEFEARQIGYIHTYGQLVPKLEQIKCINAIYTNLPPGEDVHPHPEEVLAVVRGWEVTAPLQALHSMNPMLVTEQFNYALGLQSFNQSCFHSHFRNPPPEQAGKLDEVQINDLQSQVQQLKSERSDQSQVSGNLLSGIFDAHNQLVTSQIACDLAWQNKGDITQDQLKRAQELRFGKKEPLPLPDLVDGLGSNDQIKVTSDNTKPLPAPDLIAETDTSGSSSRTQTWQVNLQDALVDQPDEYYDDEWDDGDDGDDGDEGYLTFNNVPTPQETQESFYTHIIRETKELYPGYEQEIGALGSRYLEWLDLDFGGQYISYNESLSVFKDVCYQLGQGNLANTGIDTIYQELDNAINAVIPPPPE